MTTFEHSGLPDHELLAEAAREAGKLDMVVGKGWIAMGAWKA
ncbi:hypothetical protein [Massilia frigida]|nr:hypothetical protein [Massilia frigida]